MKRRASFCGEGENSFEGSFFQNPTASLYVSGKWGGLGVVGRLRPRNTRNKSHVGKIPTGPPLPVEKTRPTGQGFRLSCQKSGGCDLAPGMWTGSDQELQLSRVAEEIGEILMSHLVSNTSVMSSQKCTEKDVFYFLVKLKRVRLWYWPWSEWFAMLNCQIIANPRLFWRIWCSGNIIPGWEQI